MTILCYHAVDAEWESSLAVRPGEFAEHMAWLARRRHIVDLPSALDHLDGRGRLPRGMAALTFDDGFASVHQHAWPVLRAASIPVALFVVAGTLASPPRTVDWVDDLPPWPLATLRLEDEL